MRKFEIFPKGEGLGSLIWMLFLLIPLLSLIPYDTFLKQFAGILLLCFAWSYRTALFHSKHFLTWIILQYLIALFYTLAFGYLQLFMFPAWQFGFSDLRRKTFWQLYALLLVLMVSGFALGLINNPQLIDSNQLIMTVAFGAFTLVAPLAGQEFYHQMEQRKQLYQSNQRLEALIKGEERNRIARELHDSLGQSLSVMTIKLDLTQKILVKKPDLAVNELDEIQTLSRSTLKTVREIVSDMRRRTIAEELVDINQALTAAKIILLTENEELAGQLNSQQQSELSYVLREAVTNIVRHSQASFCTISFEENAEWLQILIKDNGIGPKNLTAGNGVAGMRERLESLQGSLVIQEAHGTLLRISLPLTEEVTEH